VILLHKSIQVVDKLIPSVLRIFEVNTNVDSLYWANFLAHSTENASKLVDLIDDGISVPHIILSPDKTDAIRWTNSGTEPARYALGAAVSVPFHNMSSTPSR
jgi:hypothetical protein